MTFLKSTWKLLLFLVLFALAITFAATHRAAAEGYDKRKDPKRTMRHWRPRAQKQEPMHVNPSAKRAAAVPSSPKHP